MLPEGAIAWQTVLPDRIDAMEAKDKLTVLAHDGTQATLDAAGKVTSDKVLPPKAPTTQQVQSFAQDPSEK